MHILFIILTHKHIDYAVELASTLAQNSEHASVYIHVDANAANDKFRTVGDALSNTGIKLVSERVRCGWGMFGLVEAVYNALAQAERESDGFDYAILLSETCLPTRPISHLVRFLRDNPLDFIEAQDNSWITDGLRSERYKWFFPFNFQTQPRLSRLAGNLQRTLRVHRRFPRTLTPRFGSQWWALRWSTCLKILEYWRENPGTIKFFRRTWIPDEMVFQTIVSKLVPPDEIAQQNLTFVRFTNRGKPVVYFDDHVDYVATTPKFFIRKIGDAPRLRALCLAHTANKNVPYKKPPLTEILNTYQIRHISSTWFPKSGQIYFRNQYSDSPRGIIEALERKIVIVWGPDELTRHVYGYFDTQKFTVLGHIFGKDHIDFGTHGDNFHGLNSDETAIRDYDPAVYLSRTVQRCAKTPVLPWRPFCAAKFLSEIEQAQNVFMIGIVPFADCPQTEERMLRTLCDDNDTLLEHLPTELHKAATAYLDTKHRSTKKISETLSDFHAARPHKLTLPFGLRESRTARSRLFKISSMNPGIPSAALDAAIAAWHDLDKIGDPLARRALDVLQARDPNS